MLHETYLQHLQTYFLSAYDNRQFWKTLETYAKELYILTHLNLDPARELLDGLYSPVKRSPFRDPTAMLRSLILMTLLKISSITYWVRQTRSIPLFLVFAGFAPDEPPGIGTYYDFFKRIIDGPYQKPCPHSVRESQFLAGFHRRNLASEKTARKEQLDSCHSQSELLVNGFLEKSEQPRAKGFSKLLEDLLIRVAIMPTIQEGLVTDLNNLIVSGDGSVLQSAASPTGKSTCSCHAEGIRGCRHERLYTSPTAQWCYDAYRDCFLFGDRYYHLVIHQNGHDLPLLTIMPGGNESDYTLSLRAFDRFLKAARENGLDLRIGVFCGDGHHDSQAHYRYFQEKQVIPVIPLSENTKNVYPHLLDEQGVKLDTDGTPLCPEGMRMRRHQYNARRKVHVYACPVKRNTHRDGKSVYVMHQDECPRKQDCAPETNLGPLVYIKSNLDPRLYPPIPRDSERFRQLFKERSATERCNFLNDTYKLDRSSRNPSYGLIRLTLANIVEHAVVRYLEALKRSSKRKLPAQTLNKIGIIYREEFLDTG